MTLVTGPFAMISVPMTGRKPGRIEMDKKRARHFLEGFGYTVVDVNFAEKNPGITEEQYAIMCLSDALMQLQRCQAVFFCDGWRTSRGCQVEHFVAKMYGIKTIYQNDLMDLLKDEKEQDMQKLEDEVRPGVKDAPPVKQREVPPTISTEEFIETCKTILFNKESERLDKFERPNFTMDDIFVVWYCKSLQNHKALLSSKLMNGRYIEFTYNGDLKKYYVDSYEKQEHSEFTFTKEERG